MMMSYRLRTVFILVVVLLSLSAVSAQGSTPDAVGLRPDAPPYALHGPYWVGVQEFVVEPESERPLTITVWYPAMNPQGIPEEITIQNQGLPFFGHALDGAEPDQATAPYPLIVHSHGNYSTRLSQMYGAEHLASYGFVVIAPDHTGNIFANFGESYYPFFIHRPQDITRVLNFAETEMQRVMPNMIDMTKIAVTGWSFGGMTAFQAVGAQLDLKTFDSIFCSRVRAGEAVDTVNVCGLMDFQEQLAALAGLEAAPDGPWPSLADPRITAAVAFAPGGGLAGMQVFGDESYQNIKTPMLLLAGSQDTQAIPELNTYWAYTHIGSPQKALIALNAADHSVFVNSCEATPWFVTEWKYYVGCSDPVWDMDRAHDLINHFTTAFLLDVLKGDTAAHAALAPDAVSFPGITYQAEGF